MLGKTIHGQTHHTERQKLKKKRKKKGANEIIYFFFFNFFFLNLLLILKKVTYKLFESRRVLYPPPDGERDQDLRSEGGRSQGTLINQSTNQSINQLSIYKFIHS